MFKLITGHIRKSTLAAACWDIVYHGPTKIVLPGHRLKVATGISLDMPPDCTAKMEERSSQASMGVMVLGGRIDSDYRDRETGQPGEWHVILFNSNLEAEYSFKDGDRIAQFSVAQLLSHTIFESFNATVEIVATERGSTGFGSTGGTGNLETGGVKRASS